MDEINKWQVAAVGEIVLVLIMIGITWFTVSINKTTTNDWFTETAPNGQYTVRGTHTYQSELIGGYDTVSITVLDKQNPDHIISSYLFDTKISVNNGVGQYNIDWTDAGFKITLLNGDQKSIPYSFNWDDIFPSSNPTDSAINPNITTQ